ncbi:hypothetical protein VTJ83DRAFT_5048 [Remersonia thermophila]|uniref:Uncharacterized protein n=1 Tax=Remersonia thermophila TaxID=72144 RepID=A0ABR4DD66_9PEZI
MRDAQLHRARLVSSVAATLISLACGTNYVYSAWAPQFADRLHLSATEINLIGLAGNMGMYSAGIPVGLFVDNRGPRPAVLGGALCLGIGYVPFRAAYETASGSVPILCFFAFLTGLGGCMGFAAAVKTSALNWPHHRGTATAFPLAAFGLSAFFFSLVGGVLFPGNTSAFLSLLAGGTFAIIFTGFFFLKVYPHTHSASYQSVPTGSSDANPSQSRLRRRTLSRSGAKAAQAAQRVVVRRPLEPEPGTSPTTYTTPVVPGASASSSSAAAAAAATAATAGSSQGSVDPSDPHPVEPLDPSAQQQHDNSDVEAALPSKASDVAPHETEPDETSSLMSRSSSCSSSSSLAGDVLLADSVDLDRSHRIDIRGWRLLKNSEFWLLWSILGILAGIGLMTINNIGQNVKALWTLFDPSKDEAFLVYRQQLHVSILSIASFCGRLLSGVGSDFLVKVAHANRAWCLVLACVIFSIAQLFAVQVTNPNFLGFVSGLSGLGYGFLFGVFPSITAESFGIHGLSQNWGAMTLAPAISGNVFNLLYGAVFDSHTVVGEDGKRHCPVGIACYRDAYLMTLVACGVGIAVTLFTIQYQYRQRLKGNEGKGAAED